MDHSYVKCSRLKKLGENCIRILGPLLYNVFFNFEMVSKLKVLIFFEIQLI